MAWKISRELKTLQLQANTNWFHMNMCYFSVNFTYTISGPDI